MKETTRRIQTKLMDIGWGGMDRVHLSQDRDQWRAVDAGRNKATILPLQVSVPPISACTSTLKMEITVRFETSVPTYQAARLHIPNDNLHSRRCEDLMSSFYPSVFLPHFLVTYLLLFPCLFYVIFQCSVYTRRCAACCT